MAASKRSGVVKMSRSPGAAAGNLSTAMPVEALPPRPAQLALAPEAGAAPLVKDVPASAALSAENEYPNPAAAAEIEAISQAPMAMTVARAKRGTSEDSTTAPLPASYPYRTRMRRKEYEAQKLKLQIELLKVQSWVKESGQKIVTLCEGRDAAGKGGTIKRFMEHLNPRGARVVALEKPSDQERGQWYFQRYIDHLPTAGELVFFDRSWYNRAGVEHVLGFCTQQDYYRFLRQTPIFERLLVEEGIILIKYWFSVSDDEQERRFQKRVNDPLRRWKLSETDLFSRTRWVDYSRAKDEMFIHTDIPEAPWFVVEADDKKVARLNTIAHLLSKIPYEARSIPEIALPPRQEDAGYVRPPKELSTQVPDFAAEVLARHALVAPPGHDPSQGFEDDTK
jgi:polyphosphate kinase 2